MAVEVLDPERPRFEPNSEAQLRFMRSRAPKVLFTSAYGKGKTRAINEKADTLARRYPGSDIVVGRKTLASMWNTTIKNYVDKVMHPSLNTETRWRKHAEGGPTVYYPNNSRIIFMGLEDEIRAKSGEFLAAMVDQAEELNESQARSIEGRLRQTTAPWHQLGMGCNPDSRGHWIYKEFRPDKGARIIRAQKDIELEDGEIVRRGTPLAEVIISGKSDNYENLDKPYKLFLATLTGRQKLRYVDGLWISFEGSVYDMWDDDLHVQSRPIEWKKRGGYPPPHWPRHRAWDFGMRHPTVCQWWARDPDFPEPGRWWMYREIYHSGAPSSYSRGDATTIIHHARRAKKLERIELEALREAAWSLCETDPAEYDRQHYWREKLRSLEMASSYADHDRQERELLDARDVWTEPAEKDIDTGVQTMSRMLSIAPDGLPYAIFVDDALDELDTELETGKKSTCSAQDFGAYRYPPEKEGQPRKEQPLKEDDDGCDTSRYLFRSLEVAGELGYARAA